jgi:diacylglycerol O-acyltransferase
MRRLNGMDALMLYSEVPPTATCHTLKVLVVGPDTEGRSACADDLRRGIELAIDRIAPFRWRLHYLRDLHRPVWLENQEIDLDRHVLVHQLPEGAGDLEVFRTIADISSTPLSRDVPLWEVHILEGRADGAVVAVGKIHHALADGPASAQLLRKAVQPTPEELDETYLRPLPDAPPTPGMFLLLAIRDHFRQMVELPGLLARTSKGAWRVRKRPAALTRTKLFKVPQNFFTGPLSDRRTFAVTRVPMAEVLRTRKALGVTVNDVLCSAVTGAVRQVMLSRGEPVDAPLLASVPTSEPNSLRDTGNELGGFFVDIPIQEEDPVTRTHQLHDLLVDAKERQQLVGPRLVPEFAAYVPHGIAARTMRPLTRSGAIGRRAMFNLTISNVPGPRERLKIGEHPMKELWSVGPLVGGSGLNITAWSYAGTMYVSVHACARMVPDATEITDAVEASFRELADLTS